MLGAGVNGRRPIPGGERSLPKTGGEFPLPKAVDPAIRFHDEPPKAVEADPELRSIWTQGVRFEEEGRFLESTAFFEWISASLPHLSGPCWRASRNYWRFGEALPLDDLRNRQEYFELSEQWADRGLGLDPECAECILWKVAAMGRLGMTNGIVSGIRSARTVHELIETGIALDPQHRDNEFNSTLANLYYTGAVFYRLVPDWFWIKWVLGVQGDKERSHRYIRSALAISETRIDYHVELGVILLCLGHEKGRTELIEQGELVLRRVAALEPSTEWEQRDVAGARLLLDNAAQACDYSALGWIDVERALEDKRDSMEH